MKWYDDIREELTVVALFAVACLALYLNPDSQVAAGAAGALGGYLKGRKRGSDVKDALNGG